MLYLARLFVLPSQHPASHLASFHSIPSLLHTLCWLRWRSLVTSSVIRLRHVSSPVHSLVFPSTIFSLRTFACGLQPGLSEDRVRFLPHLHRLTKSHLSRCQNPPPASWGRWRRLKRVSVHRVTVTELPPSSP